MSSPASNCPMSERHDGLRSVTPRINNDPEHSIRHRVIFLFFSSRIPMSQTGQSFFFATQWHKKLRNYTFGVSASWPPKNSISGKRRALDVILWLFVLYRTFVTLFRLIVSDFVALFRSGLHGCVSSFWRNKSHNNEPALNQDWSIVLVIFAPTCHRFNGSRFVFMSEHGLPSFEKHALHTPKS